MKTNKKLPLFLLGAAALALTWAGVACADQMAASKADLQKWDSGPRTVNVSQYPDAIQNDYQLFSQKCSQCHRLSRPINCDFALPSEWSRYVKRMMFKPGSHISRSQAKKIYEFLVYDSSVRKHDLLKKKLSHLTAKQKSKEVAKIQQVYSWCGAKPTGEFAGK